jgi:3-phosphoshikimate 1-carboxyvinyltransferase
MAIDLVVYPGKFIGGIIQVPGDKSLSHRVLMLAAIASGKTYVTNILLGLDCLATIKALRELGILIDISINTPGDVMIHGQGLCQGQSRFSSSPIILDLGNSGTSMRLLAGLLSGLFAGTGKSIILTGDHSLQRRPMKRITEPLRAMGVDIMGASREQEEYAPLKINLNLGQKICPITYSSPIASAQVKSCLLLAALSADGVSMIQEPMKSRDHTEQMLQAMGVVIHEKDNVLQLAGRQIVKPFDSYYIPGDISSAAFLMVAAAITPDAVLTITQVGINSTRTGIIDLLRRMGVEIILNNKVILHNEPVADITITGPRNLMAMDVKPEDIVSAIDEFPVLFVAAACAIGQKRIEGLGELRHKESDRLNMMAEALSQLGVNLEFLFGLDRQPEGILITGQAQFQLLDAEVDIEIDTGGDHRIAMALIIASLRLKKPIILKNTENIATSFPGFIEHVRKLGLELKEVNEHNVN